MFALLGEQVFGPDYLLLETALAEGLVEIRELGPEAELRLVNRVEWAVLVVEGEELVGAKQNRAVNITILVAAGAELVIPVSCVEQGRWHYRSEKFSSESRIAAGAALVHEDRVVHLSAFRKTGGQKPGDRVGFQRYSRRRQRSLT